MDFSCEIAQITSEVDKKLNDNNKRSQTEPSSDKTDTKKLKLSISSSAETITNVASKQSTETKNTKVPQSPKRRLAVNTTTEQKVKNKFIYGNYSHYYGYRNGNKNNNKGNHDVRLDVFATREDLLRDKQVLDIGCNNGFLTMELAQRFVVKSIVGLDIDRSLINRANKQLITLKKKKPPNNPDRKAGRYPYNVSFVHGNYVLRDDVLLEIERPQFDVVLCLSITKWIHLNFGDDGLKQAFRRMYLQLRSGGKLILEAQPYDNYGRRKQLTEATHANYLAMKFFPADFTEYLLSPEVGFATVELFGVPDHVAAGFKRPIQIFTKT